MKTLSRLLPGYREIMAPDPSDWRDRLDFALPPALEAGEPPEARGLARDEVRLMVSYRSDNRIVHTRFRQIGEALAPGDLLVINTSGTINAALNAWRADGAALELHLSTHLPGDRWTVEVRTQQAQCGKGTVPFYECRAGETLRLEGDAWVRLRAPYDEGRQAASGRHHRLWLATLDLPMSQEAYLARYGFPIRYSYVKERWPLEYYQTAYATEPGSAEMPSAGRAFTPALMTELVARGVQFAPLLLHTGVASLEEDEQPYAEYYRVSPETARIVNETRAAGKRVVAVGTTVVRALETVTDAAGTAHPGEGWTGLVVTPRRGMRAVSALVTGLHEPRASHLWMLEALAGRAHLERTYAVALREGYLWHEFGDLHLILP
jgi:S-adenosylmethionine:tRNA ribosyltransferase-isomerase